MVTPLAFDITLEIDAERAEKAIDYASRKHVILLLLWRTGLRMGALHSIDVEDVNFDEAYVAVRHRPEEGTSLKNRDSGERLVSPSSETCRVVQNWIERNRPDVADDHDHRPLVATRHGRISQSNLRALVYQVTRPCQYGEECACSEQYAYSYASRSQYSRSPHSIRKGSLTHLLKNDVPKQVVADRADVSLDVLDKH